MCPRTRPFADGIRVIEEGKAMIDNSINDDKTIAGGSGTMLAGRYHILRQLGEGGMGSIGLA